MCCPTQGWSPSDRQKNRHTQHGKVWREKTSASRVLAALASSPATKALDPDPFPRHSLRHAVYAALAVSLTYPPPTKVFRSPTAPCGSVTRLDPTSNRKQITGE